MIDKKELLSVIDSGIDGTDLFLVDVIISADNSITVEVDSLNGVQIDDCITLSRHIEQNFDRDVEDYELEVGSAGLTSPFKVKAQYDKNVGNEVEVLTRNGIKTKGVLKDVTDSGFTIVVTKKVKLEGAKRPTVVEEEETYNYDEIKYTKYLMQFK